MVKTITGSDSKLIVNKRAAAKGCGTLVLYEAEKIAVTKAFMKLRVT